MNKLDIEVGDRVTYIGGFKNEFQMIITETNNTNDTYDLQNFEVLKIERIGTNGWYTVYEKQADILDKKEKEYLSAVIKPFKNRINEIAKIPNYDDLEKEFISINFIDNDDDLDFPLFKKDTMYKNMKSKKSYTLKELGLE